MKKKVLIILLVILIISGIVFFFIKSIKDDQQKTKTTLKQINSHYKTFEKSVTEFSKLRDVFYSSKENDFYLEQMPNCADNWNKFILKYEKQIKKVEKDSEYLKKHCQKYISDSLTAENCSYFKQNYETAMNYYITDINLYNTFKTKYNNWIIEENSSYTKLNQAQLIIYKKYVDYNQDGKYLGRDVK